MSGSAVIGKDSLRSVWLIRSGPHALFNGKLLIIFIISCSKISISWREVLQDGASAGKDNLVSSI